MTDALPPSGAGGAAEATGLNEGVEVTGGALPKATLSLESRLSDVLSCCACSQLPCSAVYQCPEGHLMCAGCLAQCLQQARERNANASALCPGCGLELGKELRRNRAVEKAISELAAPCRFCGALLPRHALSQHEADVCTEWPTACQLSVAGCPWRGPRGQAAEHSASCPHRERSGAQLMEDLRAMDQRRATESSHRAHLFELLSYEWVAVKDLQLRPDHGDPPEYHSNRFTMFDCEWVVNIRHASIGEQSMDVHNTDGNYSIIQTVHGKPTKRIETATRNALPGEVQLEAQLALTSTPAATQPMLLHYALLRGPFGNTKLPARLFTFSYSGQQAESTPYSTISLDTAESRCLLATPVVNIRIIMVQEEA